METKKNPKADVRRNSSIYFAVGLALMLLVANYSINYKTYNKGNIDIGQVLIVEPPEEEIPITRHKEKLPPPPPPVAPEEFEVADDEEDIEETVIESTEDNEDDPIIEIEDVQVEEEEEDVPVPFAFIESVPEFPGCERKKNNTEKRKCMSEKINKMVQRKFNTELASELGLSGKQRISVMFKIDKQGNVIGVQSRAPHPRLEKEAERVINLLPKMKPGKQRGESVIVSYSLPIIFQVQN